MEKDKDYSEGEIDPINSELQGETFKEVSPFMNLRRSQIIKKVKYNLEVEYYPEENDTVVAQSETEDENAKPYKKDNN